MSVPSKVPLSEPYFYEVIVTEIYIEDESSDKTPLEAPDSVPVQGPGPGWEPFATAMTSDRWGITHFVYWRRRYTINE